MTDEAWMALVLPFRHRCDWNKIYLLTKEVQAIISFEPNVAFDTRIVAQFSVGWPLCTCVTISISSSFASDQLAILSKSFPEDTFGNVSDLDTTRTVLIISRYHSYSSHNTIWYTLVCQSRMTLLSGIQLSTSVLRPLKVYVGISTGICLQSQYENLTGINY